MRKLNLLCCISALVLTFAAASCSSDEPTVKGGTQGQPGSKVAFSTKVSLDGNTKKIYLGTPSNDNIPVLWGNNDQVKIYTTGGEGGTQWGVYKTSSTQSGASTASLTWVGGDDAGSEIVWADDSNGQSFYSVLAPNDDESDETYGTIDASGDYTLTVPAVQTGFVATTSRGNPAAVAFGMAEDVSAGGDVTLNYTLMPGVIRLTIPAGDEISRVAFSNSNAGYKLSGKLTGSFSGAAVVSGGGDITVNKTINAGGTTVGTTTIDVYTMPFDFEKLAITVSGPNGSCTKIVQADVEAGSVTDISFGSNYTLRKEIAMQVKEASTYTLANRWNMDINYSVSGTTTTSGHLTSSQSTELQNLSVGDIVRVWADNPVTFKEWNTQRKPLIQKTINGDYNRGKVSLLSMPPMSEFTTTETSTNNNCFYYFNYKGALTSLPAGSFDTSRITTVGDYFFYNFNEEGSLTSLPEGSFDTYNITTAGKDFFAYFNCYGALTSLPAGSFKTDKFTKVGDGFFYYFNCYPGFLTSLPEGSFKTDNIEEVGDNFFGGFCGSSLTSLPAGSFNTDKIKKVGDHFFSYFGNSYNYYHTSLTSLPAGSFRLNSALTTVGNSFFSSFCGGSALTSLPEGSFDTSKITTVGNNFFYYFNGSGALTSLPAGSFKLSSNLTTVGDYFFSDFNSNGALTSLPVGSFNTSNINAGNYIGFFTDFNANNGKLEKGSSGDIVITNKSNIGITAYYYGSVSETATANGGTMIYKKQPSELPPSPVSTSAGISPKGAATPVEM